MVLPWCITLALEGVHSSENLVGQRKPTQHTLLNKKSGLPSVAHVTTVFTGSTSAGSTNHWFSVGGCGTHGYKGPSKALEHLRVLAFRVGGKGPGANHLQIPRDDCTLCQGQNGQQEKQEACFHWASWKLWLGEIFFFKTDITTCYSNNTYLHSSTYSNFTIIRIL